MYELINAAEAVLEQIDRMLAGRPWDADADLALAAERMREALQDARDGLLEGDEED